MIRRLLDRLLPDEAFSGIGRVGWRLVDPADLLTASGGLCAPVVQPSLYGEPPNWRRWPSLSDLLPTFSAPRGGIRFAQVPVLSKGDHPVLKLRARLLARRLLPSRVQSVEPSGYHDEGVPLYELTTRWRWLGLESTPRTKVLA